MTDAIKALNIVANNIAAQIESAVEARAFLRTERLNYKTQRAEASEAGNDLLVENLDTCIKANQNEAIELRGEVTGLRQALDTVKRGIRELEG